MAGPTLAHALAHALSHAPRGFTNIASYYTEVGEK